MKKTAFSIILGLASFEALGISLHNACQGYDPLAVRTAIRSGANLNERNSDNQTPLLYVASFKFEYKLAVNYAEQLLRAGAFIDSQDKNGNTALHIAAHSWSNDDLVFLLLNYGANTDIKNNEGFTVLHMLAKSAHKLKLAKILLDFGTDINIRDNQGRTALHIASAYGNVFMVQLLLQHGAQVSVFDNAGHTPVDVCCTEIGRSNTMETVENNKSIILLLLNNNR